MSGGARRWLRLLALKNPQRLNQNKQISLVIFEKLFYALPLLLPLLLLLLLLLLMLMLRVLLLLLLRVLLAACCRRSASAPSLSPAPCVVLFPLAMLSATALSGLIRTWHVLSVRLRSALVFGFVYIAPADNWLPAVRAVARAAVAVAVAAAAL